MDWKFIIGDIVIPILTFIIGIVVGKKTEKKAQAKINGNNNAVIQNSEVNMENSK